MTAPKGNERLTKDDTVARWRTGTWSGTTADRAASRALAATWKMAHHSTKATKLVALAIKASVIAERIVPPMNQGRRRPSRDVVRSLKAPAIGLVMRAASTPIAVAIERLLNLWAASRAATCMGSRIVPIRRMLS